MFSTIAIVGIAGMIALMGIIRLGVRSGNGAVLTRPPLLGRLSYCAMMVGALALAVSGFGAPMMNGGGPLTGMLLMGHMVFSGLFIAGLTGIAVFYADVHRPGCDGVPTRSGMKKFFYWCVLTLGVIATLTVLVSMVPLVGGHKMDLLMEAHRWSALLLVMSMIGHMFSR